MPHQHPRKALWRGVRWSVGVLERPPAKDGWSGISDPGAPCNVLSASGLQAGRSRTIGPDGPVLSVISALFPTPRSSHCPLFFTQKPPSMAGLIPYSQVS